MVMVLLVPIFFLFCLSSSPAIVSPPRRLCDGGNYTANSTFEANLQSLFASLSSSLNVTFTTKVINGSGSSDTVYGLFLCRGDVGLSNCSSCVENVVRDVVSYCPFYKQAVIWYDNCELRYSDTDFFSVVNESNLEYLIMVNKYNSPNSEVFVKLEMDLLDKVVYKAAYNSSLLFATGKVSNGSTPPTIYALAQCTRDISVDSCGKCLQQIRGYYNFQGLMTRQGGRLLGQSCNFRYESTYSFFTGMPNITIDLSAHPPPPLPPPSRSKLPSPAPSSRGGTKKSKNKVVPIVIPVAVGLLLIVGVSICFLRRSGICFLRRSAKNILGMATLEEISNAERLIFDLSMLKVATDNFADFQKLGQGGFGTVYKGTLPNGEVIAVKRLSASSRQGIEELKNELILVAKLQHKNLVRLHGVCLVEDEKLLVYEYMPNGSLDNFLFDPAKCKQLNWERRFKIIQGIARGLLYLHEECPLKVIHRDLKASNILLDTYMQPKIADFGLARLFGEDETQHITNRVVGTFGYMAPEYARRGHFSMKADVYSFGILVLEIVTGKRCTGFQYDSEVSQDILSYTWEHWKNGTALEVIDPSMGQNYSSSEVLRCIHIGLLCAQNLPANRPPMSSVFLMLHGPLMDLQEPLQPTFGAEDISVNSSSTESWKQSTLGSTDGFSNLDLETGFVDPVTLEPVEEFVEERALISNSIIRSHASGVGSSARNGTPVKQRTPLPPQEALFRQKQQISGERQGKAFAMTGVRHDCQRGGTYV